MRHALALCSSLLLAAACAGGGGGTPVDAGAEPDAEDPAPDAATSCGDGITNGDDGCDDGNLDSGDGCSSECVDELCGDGIINDVDETCDDGAAAADGDGCSQTCTVEAGFLCTGAPSVCVARDGSCAAPLLYAGESMTGTTTGAGNDVVAAACDNLDPDSVSGDGADHVYQLTVAGGDDVVVVLEPAFDGLIRLLTAPCDVLTEVIEPGEPEGCADFNGVDGAEILRYSNLAAGTYYVAVDGYGVDDVGGYTLSVAATATLCGNGALDGPEGCDDSDAAGGDGCGPTCQEEPRFTCTGEPSVCVPSCGNGLVDDPSEECDDGNEVDGDRCSTACVLESTVLESEPNDDAATADAVVAGSIARGVLTAGDVDVYTLTTAVPVLLELEVYTTVDGDDGNYDGDGSLGPLVDCDADLDVTLLQAGAQLAYDDYSGADVCGYLGPSVDRALMIQPGTYQLQVQGYNDGVVAAHYALDVKVTAAAAPAIDGLIINEVLANDSTFDVNCDGVTTGEQDEFVELVNVSTSFVTLAGVTLADASATRHTFSAVGLRPGEAAVVFSGGAASCASFDGVFVDISDTALQLNNTTETVTVSSAGAAVLATMSYATSTAGTSWNLVSDGTDTVVGTTSGIFAAHVPAGRSPATRMDGSAW